MKAYLFVIPFSAFLFVLSLTMCIANAILHWYKTGDQGLLWICLVFLVIFFIIFVNLFQTWKKYLQLCRVCKVTDDN